MARHEEVVPLAPPLPPPPISEGRARAILFQARQKRERCLREAEDVRQQAGLVLELIRARSDLVALYREFQDLA